MVYVPTTFDVRINQVNMCTDIRAATRPNKKLKSIWPLLCLLLLLSWSSSSLPAEPAILFLLLYFFPIVYFQQSDISKVQVRSFLLKVFNGSQPNSSPYNLTFIYSFHIYFT